MQTAIVLLIVAAAGWFALRRFLRAADPERPPSCGGCTACSGPGNIRARPPTGREIDPLAPVACPLAGDTEDPGDSEDPGEPGDAEDAGKSEDAGKPGPSNGGPEPGTENR
jgi:hypothetical protein